MYNIKYMKLKILLFSLLIGTFCQSQVIIKTADDSNSDIYPWVTFLSEGESNVVEEDSEFGTVEFCRILITTSEIYNDIYIEYGTSSFSGSRSSNTFKRKIVVRDNLREYLQVKGEFAGLKFIEWISWNSCRFIMHGREFKLLNIEKDSIEIE